MVKERKNVALILAAGSGRRMGSKMEKQLLKIGGQPMIIKTIKAFLSVHDIDQIVLVCPLSKKDEYERLVRRYLGEEGDLISVVEGGNERYKSSLLGVKYIENTYKDQVLVLIHDAARPFVSRELIEICIMTAWEKGSALPCVPLKDTVRKASETLNRGELFAVQTPQCFFAHKIRAALEHCISAGIDITDDGSAMEVFGEKLTMVMGSYENIKVTTKEDLPKMIRVGKGYDVHKVEDGLECILGGVNIPNSKGMVAHSDGDVLTHAIMDSLLGAAGLGDIGRLFPDTDETYKGISSLELLRRVKEILYEAGWQIVNIDATVICEKPKISFYKEEIIDNISKALEIDKSTLNIKGTTTEKLGFTGRQEGIASESVCLIESI